MRNDLLGADGSQHGLRLLSEGGRGPGGRLRDRAASAPGPALAPLLPGRQRCLAQARGHQPPLFPLPISCQSQAAPKPLSTARFSRGRGLRSGASADASRPVGAQQWEAGCSRQPPPPGTDLTCHGCDTAPRFRPLQIRDASPGRPVLREAVFHTPPPGSPPAPPGRYAAAASRRAPSGPALAADRSGATAPSSSSLSTPPPAPLAPPSFPKAALSPVTRASPSQMAGHTRASAHKLAEPRGQTPSWSPPCGGTRGTEAGPRESRREFRAAPQSLHATVRTFPSLP